MTIARMTVDATTDGSGNATVYSDLIQGWLISVRYIKSTFDNGVDFTITGKRDAQAIWTESNVDASAIRYPRCAVHTGLGAAVTDGYDRIYLNDNMKFVIGSGGATKAGSFEIVYERA